MTLPGKITGVYTVGVPVSDQDRAIDFYEGTLGFAKRLDADAALAQAVEGAGVIAALPAHDGG
jgi:catechol 2,3-dioxygenase-like lactoylglutathione lyase family enzyme